MSFALGAGVNLGAATGYLFLDPRHFTRGLSVAANEVDRFFQATQRQASQAVRTTNAAMEANRAQADVFRNAQGRVAQLSAAANQSAAAFQATNDRRVRSIRAFANATAAASKEFVTAKTKEAALQRRVNQLQQESVFIQEALASVPANQRGRFATGGGRVRDPFDKALAKNARDLAAAERELVTATTQLEAAQSKLSRTTTAGGRLINSADINATRDAKLALDNLGRAYGELATLRRRNFAEFGQQTKNAIRNVERAEAAELQSFRNLERARQESSLTRAGGLASPTDAARTAAFARAAEIENAAVANTERATAKRIAAERELTVAVEAEALKRERAYQQEQLALERANADVIAARAAVRQKALQDVAGIATKIALVTGVAIAASTVAFVGFEKSMINVQSITGDTDAAMADFTERVRELSVQLGISPTELAAGLYEIAQAGFSGADSMTILETSARAAVAGLTDVESAARPLIAVISAYGLSVDDAALVSDKLFAGVTAGIFSFKDLAQQLGDNVPLASQLGVSLDDLIAAYIALTKQGNSLAESTTQINGIFSRFLKPTEAMRLVVEKLGFASAEAMLRELGLAKSLQAVREATGESNEELSELFPLIRGLRGGIALTGDQWNSYVDALEQVESANEGVGDTSEVLSIQLDSNAVKLRQARQEVTGAAIDLGRGFAPAVLAAASALGSLASGFSNLSPQMQTIISHTTLFIFGLSAAVLIIVKLGTTIHTTVIAIKAMNTALQGTKIAMASTGIGLLIVGLGILAEIYYSSKNATEAQTQALADQKAQVEATNSAFNDLNTTIQNFKLDELFGPAALAQRGSDQILFAIAQINGDFLKLGDAIDAAQAKINEFKSAHALEEGLSGEGQAELDALQSNLDALVEIQERLGNADLVGQKATELLSKAFRDERIDAEALTAELLGLIEQYKKHQLSGPEVLALIDEMDHNISDFAKSTDDTTDSLEDQQAALDALEDQMNSFNESVQSLIQGTLEATSGMKDWVPWLKGVQGGLAKADESAAKLINRMARQKIGGILANIDPDIRRAVELQRNLEKVEDAILGIEEAIENNNDDMSMWQGRIDLVNDLFGTEEDRLSNLNRLLAEGTISQQEYQEILEAGNFILERSAGALEDERLEQLRNLPALAKFIKAHDDADRAIRNATDAQRGFIAAMQTSQAQTFLQTLQTLAYLAALGLIPPEVITEFIVDSAATDETGVIPAILEAMGVMKDGVIIPIDATPPSEKELADIKAELAEPVDIPTSVKPPSEKEVAAAKDTVAGGDPVIIPTLFGGPSATTTPQDEGVPAGETRDIQVNVDIEIDDDGKESLDDIFDKANDWPSEIQTRFTFTGGSAGTGRAAGGEQSGFDATVSALKNWPEDVATSFSFTSTDGEAQTSLGEITTQAQAAEANLKIVAGGMHQSFMAIATDASKFGLAAGSGFRNLFQRSISPAIQVAFAVRASIISALSFNLFGQGLFSAGTFVAGFTIGLAGGAIAAYAAAFALGAAAVAGVNAAIRSGSPSREGIDAGENFGSSIAAGMRNKELEVASQSDALGRAMLSGVSSNALGLGSISPFGQGNQVLDRTILQPTAQQQILIHQDVTVPAANFREWIETVDYVQSLDQGFSTVLATKRGR